VVSSQPAAAQPAKAPPEQASIAVLPFDNMSGDPEQAYFSDGITEDIITDLSKIAGLMVIARNSSFATRAEASTSVPSGGS
jgi:adenylate cyclase